MATESRRRRRRSLVPSILVLLVTACRSAPPTPSATLPAAAVLLHEAGVENAYPRLSSDGRRLLFQSDATGRWQLFLMDITTGGRTRLSDGTADDNFPDWSADGQWVAFVSNRDGDDEIYRMRIDGSGLERLTSHPGRDIHPYFSPDGHHVLFNSTRDNGSFDVYRLTLADRSLQRLTTDAANETCARYAPDMHSIVLLANDTRRDDIVLLDAATGVRTNVTNTPTVRDGWPTFAPDGQWIYYSTMANGRHCVHRIRPDGRDDQPLTDGGDGIEDGRAVATTDGATLVWNRRRPDGIDVLWARLPTG